MPRTRIDPRRAKLHRPYTVEEVTRLFGVHRNTVRGWIRAGLPIVDDRKPFMILGRDLRAYLGRRRADAKQPCPPGTLYCLKCRTPRAPAANSIVYETRESGAGNLRALCATCGTAMFQRARQSRLDAILPGFAMLIRRVAPHIEESPPPSLNRAHQ